MPLEKQPDSGQFTTESRSARLDRITGFSGSIKIAVSTTPNRTICGRRSIGSGDGADFFPVFGKTISGKKLFHSFPACHDFTLQNKRLGHAWWERIHPILSPANYFPLLRRVHSFPGENAPRCSQRQFLKSTGKKLTRIVSQTKHSKRKQFSLLASK